MRVVLWASLGKTEIAARLAQIPGVELSNVDDRATALKLVPEVEFLALPSNHYDKVLADAVRKDGKRLRWIQVLTAGYEGVQNNGVPPGVQVANAGDALSPAVAEHAMALLLALVKRIPEIAANHAKRGWDRGFSAHMTSLTGGTMAILGFGSIGREVAQRARAFGMKVIGVSRSAKPDPLIDEAAKPSELKAVLGRSDAVVVALPLSRETDKIIGPAELQACRRNTLLINISRGGVIDTTALAAALRDGTIGGAGLDVTDPEPLPPDHPLWQAPNLLISPHVAGASGASGRERLADVAEKNVKRALAGQPLEHVIQV